MRITFDASPMIVEQTGVAFYTERLVTHLAAAYPDDVTLHGFYYNFLGRRDTSHLPRRPNLDYMGASFMPSKIVYQLRRWGIEVPIEVLAPGTADFILYPNILGYPSLRGTPSATVIHDLTYIDLPEYVSAKLRRDLVRFVPKQIKRSAFIITVSAFTKQRIVDYYGVDPDTIVVTPIPPVTAQLHDAATAQRILQEQGIIKPYILFVGTIEPRKNIANLVKAYLSLPEATRKAYNLVIAGRIGWNCDDEVALIKQLEGTGSGVIHLGYVSNEARDILYQNASIFSSASHYEGFGMPVLEAMNYGIPCAVSDIAIFREVAGDTARYFDQSDQAAIATTWQALLADDQARATLGAQGKAHAATYSWDTVASRVHDAVAAHITRREP